jgi:hypothetical protein
MMSFLAEMLVGQADAGLSLESIIAARRKIRLGGSIICT